MNGRASRACSSTVCCRHMRLQSDPTIVYGLVGGQGTLGHSITRSELDKKTLYNTYQIDGLPPGPIDNPGRAALEAVANPARTADLYFVADGTGGHAFAETVDEHNKNVQRWRQIERDAKEKIGRRQALAVRRHPPPPPATKGNQRSDIEDRAIFGTLPTSIASISFGQTSVVHRSQSEPRHREGFCGRTARASAESRHRFGQDDGLDARSGGVRDKYRHDGSLTRRGRPQGFRGLGRSDLDAVGHGNRRHFCDPASVDASRRGARCVVAGSRSRNVRPARWSRWHAGERSRCDVERSSRSFRRRGCRCIIAGSDQDAPSAPQDLRRVGKHPARSATQQDVRSEHGESDSGRPCPLTPPRVPTCAA